MSHMYLKLKYDKWVIFSDFIILKSSCRLTYMPYDDLSEQPVIDIKVLSKNSKLSLKNLYS